MPELKELHKRFLKEQRYSTRLSRDTLRGYEQSFFLLCQVMAGISMKDVTPATLTEFFRRLETRTRMVGRGIKKVGVRKSTIATYRSKLNRFFKWLENHKHIKTNPLTLMDYPDVQYEDRKYLTRQEIEKVFGALAMSAMFFDNFLQKRNIAIFSTFLYTGLRKGELLNLKVMDVDLQRRELTVRAETSKSRLRRIIPISLELSKILREYFIERYQRKLATPFLFVSSNYDGGLTANGLKHLVETIRKSSRVNFHLHQLRHTFAVNLLNNGSDIAKLKQLLGHRDIRMTATYLRCLPTTAMRGDVETLTLDNLV
ncbi:Phage integrase family protein [Candidatus Zixiibacteriota bacterium]|nr:Phage integrase family protein [candidate division Zixibacteria bacterium]